MLKKPKTLNSKAIDKLKVVIMEGAPEKSDKGKSIKSKSKKKC